MNKIVGTMTGLLVAVAFGTAAQAGVAAKFELQSGGTIGKGRLQDATFIWTATRDIEKTMESAILRVRDFAGQTLTFTFDIPVDIEYVRFWSLNVSSSSSITFYDASGAILPVGKTVTSSPDGVTGFSETVENNAILFSGCPGKENFSAQIDIHPSVVRVSKIVIEVKKEGGLMDVRIGGTAKQVG